MPNKIFSHLFHLLYYFLGCRFRISLYADRGFHLPIASVPEAAPKLLISLNRFGRPSSPSQRRLTIPKPHGHRI